MIFEQNDYTKEDDFDTLQSLIKEKTCRIYTE